MKFVHHLQNLALQSENSIVDLLRNAYVIACKLNLLDFKQWILHELNGYDNIQDLPQYRFISSVIKFNNPCYGWLETNISDKKLLKELAHLPITDKISEIHQLISDKNIPIRYLPPNLDIALSESYYGMKAAIFLNEQQLFGIIDCVRTQILDWSLTLEQKGILGDNMTFDENELKNAQGITINNFVGSVANTPMQQGLVNTMTIENSRTDNIEIAKSLVSEINKMLENMPPSEDKDTILADVSTIDSQLKSPKPKINIIKEVARSIRNILEGSFGSLIANAYPKIHELLHNF